MAMVMEMPWGNGEGWIKSEAQKLQVRQMEAEGWWGLSVEVHEDRVRAMMTNTKESRKDFVVMAVDEDGSVEVVG